MAGTTINPYRFGGQVGYRRDGTNRNYVRARHLDTQRGRWISYDPTGFIGSNANLYQYAYNNPIRYGDPDGMKPIKHHHPANPILPCPLNLPTDLETSDYAIACSNRYASAISADFTLPNLCNVKAGYINFYLSMGGFEAGVSFGDKFREWKAFFNMNGNEPHLSISLSPGQTVKMSLTRKASGFVEFVINGMSMTSQNRLSKLDQARAVTGVSHDSCPQAHSLATWSNISVQGGMNPKPWKWGAEQIHSNLLSSTLHKATLPCDSSQY